MQTLDEAYNNLEGKNREAELGGGIDKIKKQHNAGRLTARERILLLLDPNTFSELDKLVIHRCQDVGTSKNKVLGDGMVTGYGKIDGRLVFVSAQEFTVFGGTMSRANADKVMKVMATALKVGV